MGKLSKYTIKNRHGLFKSTPRVQCDCVYIKSQISLNNKERYLEMEKCVPSLKSRTMEILSHSWTILVYTGAHYRYWICMHTAVDCRFGKTLSTKVQSMKTVCIIGSSYYLPACVMMNGNRSSWYFKWRN